MGSGRWEELGTPPLPMQICKLVIEDKLIHRKWTKNVVDSRKRKYVALNLGNLEIWKSDVLIQCRTGYGFLGMGFFAFV